MDDVSHHHGRGDWYSAQDPQLGNAETFLLVPNVYHPFHLSAVLKEQGSTQKCSWREKNFCLWYIIEWLNFSSVWQNHRPLSLFIAVTNQFLVLYAFSWVGKETLQYPISTFTHSLSEHLLWCAQKSLWLDSWHAETLLFMTVGVVSPFFTIP